MSIQFPYNEKSTVLITNGNAMSMIALADWLIAHGDKLQKVYVTYRLPSSKSNLRGIADILANSGPSYMALKVWTNRWLPWQLRASGLPSGIPELLESLRLNCPVVAVDSVNKKAVVDEMRALAPDYLLSFSATQRFSDDLIGTPKKAALNVHYGALPAYAGLSPYFWHLYNEASTFGVTLHNITPRLDAGPIIEQTHGTAADAKSCLALALRMAGHVSPLLLRFYNEHTSADTAQPQPSEGRSYFRHPTKAQVQEFKRSGYQFMDKVARGDVLAEVRDIKSRVNVAYDA